MLIKYIKIGLTGISIASIGLAIWKYKSIQDENEKLKSQYSNACEQITELEVYLDEKSRYEECKLSAEKKRLIINRACQIDINKNKEVVKDAKNIDIICNRFNELFRVSTENKNSIQIQEGKN